MSVRRTERHAPVRPAPARRPPERRLLFPLGLAAAAAAVYWNSLSAPFIWDDQVSIVDNPTIRHLVDALRPPLETPVTGRPLVNLTFAVNYALGGLDPAGYHVVNIALHALCALLLFGIARRTILALGDPAASTTAFLIAALWMLHPLQSEVVDYVTERSESLMAAFFLLTIYAAIRARRAVRTDLAPGARRGWQAAAIAACAAGMASKETMVAAPLVVVAYDWAFDRGALRSRRLFYAALGACWIAAAALMLGSPRSTVGVSSPSAVATYAIDQIEMIGRYLWLAVWPRALVLDYGLPRPLPIVSVLPQAAVISLLLAATLVALVRAPRLGFLGLWFFLTLAPTSSLVPIRTEVGAERRMYLPSMALAAFAVIAGRWLIARAGRVRQRRDRPDSLAARAREPARGGGRPLRVESAGSWAGLGRAGGAAAAAAGVLLLALSARTIARNREYGTPLAMWQSVVERWPHGRARMALATELMEAGDYAAAIGHLRQAVADFPDARSALGTALLLHGDTAEGIAVLDAFVADAPSLANRIPARLLLARALAARGQLDRAADQLLAVLALAPNHAEAHEALGTVLVEQGRYAEAVGHLRRALDRNPRSAPLNRLLAEAYLRIHDAAASEPYARAAVAAAPGDAAAHNLLGVALASTGRLDEAAAQFRQALALAPGDAQVRANLERASRAAGRPPPR